MPGTKIEDKYQKKTQHEHILIRPDTYMDTIKNDKLKIYIFDDNKNKIFGVISIQANKKNAFDDENVFVMKLLAELAVIAIQNHIQYQKLLKYVIVL